MKYKFGGDPSGQDGLTFPSYLMIDIVTLGQPSYLQLLWLSSGFSSLTGPTGFLDLTA